MAQNLFRGVGKKNKKGKEVKGKAFGLAHCFKELENEEKWKTRELKVKEKKMPKDTMEAHIVDDDEATSEELKRSPTPNSVAYSKPKTPIGNKKAKENKKNGGDDDIKVCLDALVAARKEAQEEIKMEKTQMRAVEERRIAAVERRAEAEERKILLEDKKVAMEEEARLVEMERNLFFMDTSKLDDKQKEYVNLCRDQVLHKKRMMSDMSGIGGMEAYGGIGGVGGMGEIGRAHV